MLGNRFAGQRARNSSWMCPHTILREPVLRDKELVGSFSFLALIEQYFTFNTLLYFFFEQYITALPAHCPLGHLHLQWEWAGHAGQGLLLQKSALCQQQVATVYGREGGTMRGNELSFPTAIVVMHLVLPYEMLLPLGAVALGCELYSACVEPRQGVPCPSQN